LLFSIAAELCVIARVDDDAAEEPLSAIDARTSCFTINMSFFTDA
jgi:hypothetical protein